MRAAALPSPRVLPPASRPELSQEPMGGPGPPTPRGAHPRVGPGACQQGEEEGGDETKAFLSPPGADIKERK